MPDIKGTLFWMAVVLALLIYMMRGCGSGIDKFREFRQDNKQQRQERRNNWNQEREKRRENWQGWQGWRERRKKFRDDNEQDDGANPQGMQETETAGKVAVFWISGRRNKAIDGVCS
jgi:hypothetical protein